jgi:hypothetical protein
MKQIQPDHSKKGEIQMNGKKEATNIAVGIDGKPASELPVSIGHEGKVSNTSEARAALDASALAATEFRNKAEAARERKIAIMKRIAEIDKSIVDKKNNRAAIRAIDERSREND